MRTGIHFGGSVPLGMSPTVLARFAAADDLGEPCRLAALFCSRLYCCCRNVLGVGKSSSSGRLVLSVPFSSASWLLRGKNRFSGVEVLGDSVEETGPCPMSVWLLGKSYILSLTDGDARPRRCLGSWLSSDCWNSGSCESSSVVCFLGPLLNSIRTGFTPCDFMACAYCAPSNR